MWVEPRAVKSGSSGFLFWLMEFEDPVGLPLDTSFSIRSVSY
jgi:hypothetical protein